MLATHREIIEPRRWRICLPQDVTFHDNSPFAADDVVFSAERARQDGFDLKPSLAGVVDVIAVDERTVDLVTLVPDPRLAG